MAARQGAVIFYFHRLGCSLGAIIFLDTITLQASRRGRHHLSLPAKQARCARRARHRRRRARLFSIFISAAPAAIHQRATRAGRFARRRRKWLIVIFGNIFSRRERGHFRQNRAAIAIHIAARLDSARAADSYAKKRFEDYLRAGGLRWLPRT